MNRALYFFAVFFMGVLAISGGCHRSQPSAQSSPVPPDLQETVNKLVQAVEAFDIPHVLDAYTEDFTSGTGRSKAEVRQVLEQLQASHVGLKVESAEVETADPGEASLKTRLRLRYKDRFRDLGEGEVVVTDVLVHKLRKDAGSWKIYADERVATYREGRFGQHPPNIELDVPEKLPTDLQYPVKVVVQREADTDYQVLLGNYAEDPAFLPPPDIVAPLPKDGTLQAHLLPNPQGRSEMVRITVIATDPAGKWIGATTVSKLVPGAQRKKKGESREMARAY
jgi:ketosteroid isomerase-like protein